MLEQLMDAAMNGDVDRMRELIGKDPELINAVMPTGESPLTAALYYGKREAVEFLLDQGVSVTIHEAAALGDDETIDYMLGIAPELISETNHEGWTPLHLACFFGGYEAAKLLIERGADVKACSLNVMKNHPIHLAASGKRTLIVHLLLENDADPNAKKYGGVTPLQQAVEQFDMGMVKLLLEFGADPDAVRDDGKSAITLAEEHGYLEILDVLNQKRNERNGAI